MKNKKAAIELSIGTVVIIVLAMTMLILGLVLVNKIFFGATESVDTLNDKVKAELTGLFSEDGSKIGIKLGPDKTAKVKQGTNGFGIGIGAQTRIGEAVTEDFTYSLELTNSDENCPGFQNYILDHDFSGGDRTGRYQFEDAEGDNAFVRLVLNIPDGVGECTQRLKITTYDAQDQIAFSSFRVQIISGGIFN